MFSKKANIFTKKVAFMDFSPSGRAKIVVQYVAQKQKITMAKVGQKMGYTNRSAFSAVINGLKVMPMNFVERLAALDPDINPDFLTGTSDEMLLSEHERPATPELFPRQGAASGVYLPLELVTLFTNLSDTIRSQQETIRALAGKVPQAKTEMK